MKFRGQIKIPEVDHPAVGSTVFVDGNHIELFISSNESLGRWSLADVRADRLVSNAFSLQLDDEEVTFLADDPIDFAYRGVEHMANQWARYKAMALPRRIVATRRSRSDTRPSRLHELRDAMDTNLAGTAVTAIPRAPESGQTPRRLPGVGSPADQTPPNQRTPRDEPVVEPPEPIQEMPSIGVSKHEEAVQPVGNLADEPVPTPAPSLEEQTVFKDTVPWAAKDAEDDLVDDSPFAETREAVSDPAEPSESGLTEDRPPPMESDEKSSPAPWLIPESGSVEPPVALPPVVEEDDEHATAAAEAVEPVSNASETPPASIEMEAEEETTSGREDEHERYIVDLGAFEGPGDDGESESARKVASEPVPEPALSAADGRGGLMGAVRSAFVRNKAAHDHDYVAAPGGIGITRQICTECGHISIGVAERSE